MRISVAEAEGQLKELMKRAEQGEEVVLTQDGLPPVKLEVIRPTAEGSIEAYDAAAELEKLVPLTAVRLPLSSEEKRKIFEKLRDRVRDRNLPPGPDAARSQDFLYDEFGLPK